MGILLGGCLTVKNLWGLLTGGDEVGFSGFLKVVSDNFPVVVFLEEQ